MRLVVTLDSAEGEALARMACGELRDPRDQLRHILRQELVRRGLLQADEDQVRDHAVEVLHHE